MSGGTEHELSNMTLSDDEFEEDEILVHVEFDCEVDHNIFNPDSTFKLLEVDSDNPLMQLGNKVYQGEWRDVVGTSVFFEDDDEKKVNQQKNADPLFSKLLDNPLKLACCTRKSLLMSRVFVKPKTDEINEKSVPEIRTEESMSDSNELITPDKIQDEESVHNSKTDEMDAT